MRARVADWQIERVQLLSEALRRNLPIPSLPRASRVLARDCEVAVADGGLAHSAAVGLLLAYSTRLALHRPPAFSTN